VRLECASALDSSEKESISGATFEEYPHWNCAFHNLLTARFVADSGGVSGPGNRPHANRLRVTGNQLAERAGYGHNQQSLHGSDHFRGDTFFWNRLHRAK